MPISDQKREYRAKWVALPLVLGGLAYESVQVQARHRAARHAHQGPAGQERISCPERAGAIGGQLGGPRPLEQREVEGFQGQTGQGGAAQHSVHDELHELECRHEGHVVRQHVAHLVCEHRMQLVGVERSCESRGDKRHGLVRADGERVAHRVLGHIKVRARGDVEGVGISTLHRPYLGQLVLPEAHGGAEHQLAKLALVADLTELLDHAIEHGDGVQSRGGGPVRGMGESLSTDVRVTE